MNIDQSRLISFTLVLDMAGKTSVFLPWPNQNLSYGGHGQDYGGKTGHSMCHDQSHKPVGMFRDNLQRLIKPFIWSKQT